MIIYEYINTITDCENIVFTIFDCNKEDLVSICNDDDIEIQELTVDDIMYSDYTEYEIGGIDMWIDKGKIHIEFNIDVEDE